MMWVLAGCPAHNPNDMSIGKDNAPGAQPP